MNSETSQCGKTAFQSTAGNRQGGYSSSTPGPIRKAPRRGSLPRLEEIANALDMNLGGSECRAVENLLEEGKKLLSETVGDIRDGALIGLAQRIEHYEMPVTAPRTPSPSSSATAKPPRSLAATLVDEKVATEELTELAVRIIPATPSHRRMIWPCLRLEMQ